LEAGNTAEKRRSVEETMATGMSLATAAGTELFKREQIAV
jgi:hypothetical protein